MKPVIISGGFKAAADVAFVVISFFDAGSNVSGLTVSESVMLISDWVIRSKGLSLLDTVFDTFTARNNCTVGPQITCTIRSNHLFY
jgi:hypothetical protein